MSASDIPRASFAPFGFPIALVGMAVVLGSSSLPSPFYPVLQQKLGFAPVVMTEIFSAYALVILATLLIAGSVSDHLGRRPVLCCGFLLLALAGLAFNAAGSPLELILARALQGLACGLLLTTLSATIVDLEPPAWPGLAVIGNSVLPLIGMGLGALVSGAVMENLADAEAHVFHGLAVVSVLLAVLVWTFPETSPRHEGLLQALKPRIGVPTAARAMFLSVAPALAASWATGGFYLVLGASIIGRLFGIKDGLPQAGVVTILAGCGALACFFARKASPRATMFYGTASLALGTAVTLLGILWGNLTLYLLALACAGTGFGTCFFASLRSVVPRTPASERGELFSAIFTLSYLAYGVPVIIAGLALPIFGLFSTSLVYGGIVAVMATLAGLHRKFRTRG